MTYPDLISLPFHVSRTLYGVHGLMRLEEGKLVLECQPVENIVGLIRGPLRIIEIPFPDVAEISINSKGGPLGGKLLRLRTLYLSTLRRFPGAHEGELQLRIRRNHVMLAEDFVSRVELELTEASLRHLTGAHEEPPLLSSPATRMDNLMKVWEGIKGLLR